MINYDHTGWCQTTGMTCHTTLMSYVAKLPTSSLSHILEDCRDAVAAFPENGKSGHYEDTAHYCAAEEKRRILKDRKNKNSRK